jgi:hypothetical protein
MKIIAYTFEADVHCPACTKARAPSLRLDHAHPHAIGTPMLDEHGVEYDLADREGNLIHPVLDTDEHEFTACSDCGEEVA